MFFLQKRKYLIDNRKYFSEYRKKYYLNNKEKILERNKKYLVNNYSKEYLSEYQKEYNLKNKTKISEQKRKYNKEHLHSDIQYKLRRALRTRLIEAVKGNFKAGSAVRDLGCTIPEFKIYIENKFQEGMSWDNWSLYGWHIDHKIPLSSFDLTEKKQFLEACNYINLQPLWAKENLLKSKKLIYA